PRYGPSSSTRPSTKSSTKHATGLTGCACPWNPSPRPPHHLPRVISRQHRSSQVLRSRIDPVSKHSAIESQENHDDQKDDEDDVHPHQADHFPTCGRTRPRVDHGHRPGRG